MYFCKEQSGKAANGNIVRKQVDMTQTRGQELRTVDKQKENPVT